MKSKFAHFNFNVLDLKKSMEFYEEALGLKEVSVSRSLILPLSTLVTERRIFSWN